MSQKLSDEGWADFQTQGIFLDMSGKSMIELFLLLHKIDESNEYKEDYELIIKVIKSLNS